MNPASPNKVDDTKAAAPKTTQTKMSPESIIDWWSNWSDRLGMAAIILGAILAAVTAFGWVAAWKAGKLKDISFARYKQESDERIAQLQKETKEAELALEKLREAHADRTITDEQRATFISALKNVPKHGAGIMCTRHSDEAVAYSDDFEKLLTGAGFNVINDRDAILQGLGGLTVVVNNSDPVNAKAILDAFFSIGIKAKGQPMPGKPDCDVVVMVGYKPLNAIINEESSSPPTANKNQ